MSTAFGGTTASDTAAVCERSFGGTTAPDTNLEKAKTVGRMKSKFVRRSALYPTYGKKGGMKKDDLLIVDDAGTVLPPRAFIYNTSALLGANPRVVAVERANFDPETFQFPDFDRRTDVPIDEEDDEVDDEESDDED